MLRSPLAFLALALSISLAACGGGSSDTGSGGGGEGTTTGTGGTTGSTSEGGASTGTGGTGTTTTTSTSTTTSTGTSNPGLSDVGSLVILGDSISDGGGVPPYYYNLLVNNDGAKYPEWAGKDLKTRYGSSLQVVKASKAGAVSSGLPGQVSGLPSSLPGPVAVVITIGGNDMQANIVSILQGTDQGARDSFRANIATAVGELTMPGRFGAGVDVHVFEADIYDPTDGSGDFSSCPVPLSFVPKTPSDGFFGAWNAVVTDEVPKHGMSVVPPLHDTFHNHGVIDPPQSWFHTDCIHPNAKGHNAIRGMFWKAITGEDGPAPG
jgi:lysophospholipase L1-like esterase